MNFSRLIFEKSVKLSLFSPYIVTVEYDFQPNYRSTGLIISEKNCKLSG